MGDKSFLNEALTSSYTAPPTNKERIGIRNKSALLDRRERQHCDANTGSTRASTAKVVAYGSLSFALYNTRAIGGIWEAETTIFTVSSCNISLFLRFY